MRAAPAESLPGTSTGSPLRRFSTLLALLLVMVALACHDDSPQPTAPSPQVAVGTLSGSVTLLGNYGPSNPPGHIQLFTSREQLDRRIARYDAPLFRRSGPVRTYGFIFPGIAPGEYYVLACWSIGCGEYRERATGALRTVRVNGGRMTTLHFGL